MTDRQLLDDLIAKLRDMQEQLSMAQLEAAEHSLLGSRIRHLTILAHYVRMRLEGVKRSPDLLTKPAHEADRDSPSRT